MMHRHGRHLMQRLAGVPLVAMVIAAQPAPDGDAPPQPSTDQGGAVRLASDPPPPALPGNEIEDRQRRVVRGTPALPGTAPWQVQLFTTVKLTRAALRADATLRDDDENKKFLHLMEPWERDHRCGAVLIDEGWALTAAHCFVNTRDRLVNLRDRGARLGNNDVRLATPMRVERVIVHGDYSRTGSRQHDIALIRLVATADTDMAVAANARPVRLPEADGRPLGPADTLKVTGWGNTGEREAGASRDVDGLPLRKSPVLLEGLQALQDPARCAAVASLRDTMNPGVLCVGAGDGRGQDSCQGDSGGPLTRRGVLFGLVSGGEGCGVTGRPALYTNVAHYLDWIAAARAGSRPGMVARCRAVTRGGRPALACTA